MSNSAENLSVAEALLAFAGASAEHAGSRRYHTPEALAKRLGALLENMSFGGGNNALIVATILCTTVINRDINMKSRLYALASLTRNHRKLSDHFTTSVLPKLLQDALNAAEEEGLDENLDLLD